MRTHLTESRGDRKQRNRTLHAPRCWCLQYCYVFWI